jgi:acetyltransferase-like isoleucine patch superfamily enzyme
MIRRALLKLEGGIMWSVTLRRVYCEYYGVEIGRLTYGAGIIPGAFYPGSRIGSFCSVARGVDAVRRNHPTTWISQSPIFTHRSMGVLTSDSMPDDAQDPLEVGHDVWLGTNAFICPGCRKIGNGAIVAAGAVVTKDVPAFTIVGGNPARVLRKRFPDEVEAIVAASEWWLRPLSQILPHLDLFTQEATPIVMQEFSEAFSRK